MRAVITMKSSVGIPPGTLVTYSDTETVRPARGNERALGRALSYSSGLLSIEVTLTVQQRAIDALRDYFRVTIGDAQPRKRRKQKKPNRAQRRKLLREAEYLARQMAAEFE